MISRDGDMRGVMYGYGINLYCAADAEVQSCLVNNRIGGKHEVPMVSPHILRRGVVARPVRRGLPCAARGCSTPSCWGIGASAMYVVAGFGPGPVSE